MPDELLTLGLPEEDIGFLIPLSLPAPGWIRVLQQSCDFDRGDFKAVSLNLIKNPNINSSLLFRADILYDSVGEQLPDAPLSAQDRDDALEKYRYHETALPGFVVKRMILRRMIPRNPQLDKPILQTCLLLSTKEARDSQQQHLVIYIPHCSAAQDLPWYHPRVQALAYLHSWRIEDTASQSARGNISLHYLPFSDETIPLSDRLLRTAQHLLTTIYKHGQGHRAGYQKKVHHDQLVSQQRVQNTYSDLKGRHANRLCERWVEATEPSKHVFEDLGIAAFLIEVWRDMYRPSPQNTLEDIRACGSKPQFPGFVDIGCGNGVLVDVLTREGYTGWGFDARKRKTWSTFETHIQERLKELILIPQPFFETQTLSSESLHAANASILCPDHGPGSLHADSRSNEGLINTLPAWHNGIFPTGTFIISNHADELTAWTPLLAHLSGSPFLAIPCCSHNLSGARFRAPSVFNNNSADALAPSYFAASISTAKSVAIKVAEPDDNYGLANDDDDVNDNAEGHDDLKPHTGQPMPSNHTRKSHPPESGDLKTLAPKSRAKQPSAYASLCDWVAHLSREVGYTAEREILRIPSTRNLAIVCRDPVVAEHADILPERLRRVIEIAVREKADGEAWVRRARGLGPGGKNATGEH